MKRCAPVYPRVFCLVVAAAALRLAVSPVPAAAQNDLEETVDAGASSPREIIDDLIRERATDPIVPQQSRSPVETIPSRVGVPATVVDLDPAVVGVLPGQPLPRLRREGEFIVERPGQLLLVEDAGYWVFAFDTVPGQADLRPMIVQLCQRLASMQDTMDQLRRDDLAFTLTGQVHTYRGVNYLLPTSIAGTRTLPAEAAAAQQNAADGPADTPPGDPFADAGLPGNPNSPGGFETPGTFDAAGPADPIDLLDDLLEQREAAPARPDTSPVIAAADQALDDALQGINPDNEKTQKLRREGEYLVHRAGRLVRGITAGGLTNVLFAFEADGEDPAAAEPPMRIMPNKLLELMEDTVIERGDQAVFIVSGRIHAYRGSNHLLVTTVRQPAYSENLSP
ncbi:MAG: hypothetical protein AAGG38_12315 [Planctomycetota bacterium]